MIFVLSAGTPGYQAGGPYTPQTPGTMYGSDQSFSPYQPSPSPSVYNGNVVIFYICIWQLQLKLNKYQWHRYLVSLSHPIIIREVTSRPYVGIPNSTFCQKNGIQWKRIHNRYYCSVCFGPHPLWGSVGTISVPW